MREKCCGECKYNKRDWTNPNKQAVMFLDINIAVIKKQNN